MHALAMGGWALRWLLEQYPPFRTVPSREITQERWLQDLTARTGKRHRETAVSWERTMRHAPRVMAKPTQGRPSAKGRLRDLSAYEAITPRRMRGILQCLVSAARKLHAKQACVLLHHYHLQGRQAGWLDIGILQTGAQTGARLSSQLSI